MSQRLGEETNQQNVGALGCLAACVVDLVMCHFENISNSIEKTLKFKEDWIKDNLIDMISMSSYRASDKVRVSSGSVVLEYIIACLQRCMAFPFVLNTVVFTLDSTVKIMTQNFLAHKVSAAYLPVQRCIEILKDSVDPKIINAIFTVCLNNYTDEDWQVSCN